MTSPPLDVIAKINDIHAFISEQQLKLADVYRATNYYRRTKPFEFAEIDVALLSTANLLLRSQPCTKFRQRFIGPYAISAKNASHAYRPRLPKSTQCHNVFHISNLKPCHSPQCSLDIDAPHNELIVDAMSDFRITHSPDRSQRDPRLEFLVRKGGYDITHDSWEAFANLEHVVALIHGFTRST
jgi:hypothetical protein